MTNKLRVFVSRLIKQVLVGKITVSAALKAFPNNYMVDESLDTAFHALVHFEADEDLRKRDALYREEQDEYLQYLAEVLERGDDIAVNIIGEYKKYYSEAPIYKDVNDKYKFSKLFKFINIKKD
ncbi:hypothetical protein IJC60_00330 [bacterium]|nr:hypothetical protein [bacterium]